MGLIDLHEEDGQTPLDEDEKDGLLIPAVTTRGELDEVEQYNIETAVQWTIRRRKRFTAQEILTEQFVKALHQRMFGSVWEWVGQFRRTDKNIGVDKYRIGMELLYLLDDCKYWIAHHTYPPEEIAIRFKHRLVSIHCFANGNGRHSRLMADLIIEKIFGLPVFTWGGRHLAKVSDARKAYLTAIREADNGNFEPLIRFARS